MICVTFHRITLTLIFYITHHNLFRFKSVFVIRTSEFLQIEFMLFESVHARIF